MAEGTSCTLAVDTADVDEAVARLRVVDEDIGEVGRDLAGLGGVLGLAVGADAVLDALGDLGATWHRCCGSLQEQAVSSVGDLQAARRQYVLAETTARSLVDLLACGDLRLPAGPPAAAPPGRPAGRTPDPSAGQSPGWSPDPASAGPGR